MAKFASPFLRTPYNYDMMEVSNETGLFCPEPSKTVQADKDDADINTIVKRFGLGMKLPEAVRLPQYGDFEGVTDYQSALNLVIAAEDGFMKFPAHIRSRFHNNPAAFLDFVGNDANREEAERMGILVPKPAAEPVSRSAEGGGASGGAKAPPEAQNAPGKGA